MLSYQNSPELKARFVAHVERHRQADQLVRGTYGTMEDGIFRGCAVGCAVRSLDEIDGRELKLKQSPHKELADRIGVPLVLAHLEDRIFEGLSPTEAMLWPTLFARAIPVGADLSLVWPRFAHWLLVDPTAGVIRFARSDSARAAINGVAALFARQAAGENISRDEWMPVRSASASASASAAYAYASAAASAYASSASASAYASAYAAYAYASAYAAAAAAASAAASASDSASDSDSDASMQRHFQLMAEKLLQLLGDSGNTKAGE